MEIASESKTNTQEQGRRENDEIVKRSQKPHKAQDEMIQKIIQKNEGYDKDISNLEKQLLGGHNDVNTQELMDAQLSFSVDPNLSNDSNLPQNVPKLDSDLNNKSEVSDYNNLNF
mmetsp:Transcript_28772/g.28481  ORF Transcript_28772/g.28481 Transcript_28772/m.28481 type:complete len:115 (-) Transcript_28772:158-502(-)